MNTPKQKKFSAYFYNPITYVGVYLAALIFVSECFLFAIDLCAHGRNLYLGLLTYIFLPPFLIIGLLLIPIGAFWEKRRIASGKPASEFQQFRIDLSIPQHRNTLFVFVVGTVVLVMMTFAGLYKGFQYTESVEFCGIEGEWLWLVISEVRLRGCRWHTDSRFSGGARGTQSGAHTKNGSSGN